MEASVDCAMRRYGRKKAIIFWAGSEDFSSSLFVGDSCCSWGLAVAGGPANIKSSRCSVGMDTYCPWRCVVLLGAEAHGQSGEEWATGYVRSVLPGAASHVFGDTCICVPRYRAGIRGMVDRGFVCCWMARLPSMGANRRVETGRDLRAGLSGIQADHADAHPIHKS